MTENNFKRFDVVQSLKGHDKNNLYVVIKTENKFVYLCDGKVRSLNNLKVKNFKHLKLINLNEKCVKFLLKNLQDYAKLENSKLIETLKFIKGEINV